MEFIAKAENIVLVGQTGRGKTGFPDQVLAAQLYQRGVSVSVIENAFVLAATRRLMRPADAPPLGKISSLAYFLPVIEEVLGLRVSPDYFPYLRNKLERVVPIR